jgi:hypothetical protein
MVLLPELLRFIGVTGRFAGNVQQITYAVLLLALMLTGKNGLFGWLNQMSEGKSKDKTKAPANECAGALIH